MAAHFWLEVRLLLRTRLFVVMAAVFVLLAAFAGWQGGQFARSQATAIGAAKALEAAHDAEALAKAEEIISGEIDPPWWQSPLNVQAWSYAMIRHVHLPPKPLAGAAIADADLQPFLFRINPHPPDRWANRSSELTPSVAAQGGFDLADILLILTPLLVIVAFADVIRDRNGTERQRLATVQSAGEIRLLALRLLPRAGLLTGLVVIAALIGVAATLPPAKAEVLSGGLAIAAIAALHALFWLALAVLLILFVRSAVTTSASVVGLWFLLGVLAPLLAEGAARITSPSPSPLEVFAAERAATVAARMQEDDLTRAYAETDPMARDMLLEALARDQLLITPTNLLVQKEVDRKRGDAQQAEASQRDAFDSQIRRFASASPSLLARQTMYRVAGRDATRRAEFNNQVDKYYADLQEIFVPLLMRRATLDKVLLPEPFEFEE